MTTFYTLLDNIKATLDANPFVNTITYGDIFDVDLDKHTMYPLSHFLVNSANYNGATWTFDLSVICMDIVDVSKQRVDEFTKNTNEHDIFNTQLSVVNDLLDNLRKGSLADVGYQINGTPTVEAFVDRFADQVAGWTLTMQIDIKNDYSLC